MSTPAVELGVFVVVSEYAEAVDFEKQLLEDVSEFYFDLYGLVMYLFPWGEKGTLLEKHDGPDEWQKELLDDIGAQLKEGKSVQEAISSGHGIGKSCECAWIIITLMSLRPHLNGVVTANTQAQLSSKTWKELAVWHKLALNNHWFKWTATKFSHVQHPETWFVQAIPQSENNPEAFAGLHAEYVLIIYDEASAIPDCIWEVSEGAMTTPEAVWVAFGNPTRNSGRFRNCFPGGKFAHRWGHKKIDSRTAKMTDKKKINGWLEDYGEDSDFFRIRVRGEFPRAGSNQFIGSDIVLEAQQRQLELREYISYRKLMGVDVARFGDDRSVITIRQGMKMFDPNIYRGMDNMELAGKVVELYREHQPYAIYVDGIGNGSGVVDRLRQLGLPVVDVVVSNAATKPREYANLRAEIWGEMRAWLKQGADIIFTDEMSDDLVYLEYGYNNKMQIQLESKKDLKERVGFSPDLAESLALTFAPFKPMVNVQNQDLLARQMRQQNISNKGWT
ncbi:terminase [Aliikangiella coralliicola]|uniref:Terminase n=1 Tax=Aliikangiella coralliicola TaxID=2592383 RepID=A0A545U058_9GAMM|nr:terminase [Aliikangiella coralliicola]TQV82852.1 terminase [Aliikangiella coralliicola]